METLSTISLTFGILSFVVLPLVGGIVAIATGVAAKTRIDKSGGRKTGHSTAVSGEALGIVNVFLAVLVAVAIAIAASTGPTRVEFTQLKVGQCFNGLSGDFFPSSVNTIACAKPHLTEVVGTFQATDPGHYPSAAEFHAQANSNCLPLATMYVAASQAPSLHIYFVFPNQPLWDSGVRSVVCGVQNIDGTQHTGSVRGPARSFTS